MSIVTAAAPTRSQDGKFHGHGTFTHPDGRSAFGKWEDGKFNGHGYMKSGLGLGFPETLFFGKWEDGKNKPTQDEDVGYPIQITPCTHNDVSFISYTAMSQQQRPRSPLYLRCFCVAFFAGRRSVK
jgi:hypothetical protein